MASFADWASKAIICYFAFSRWCNLLKSKLPSLFKDTVKMICRNQCCLDTTVQERSKWDEAERMIIPNCYNSNNKNYMSRLCLDWNGHSKTEILSPRSISTFKECCKIPHLVAKMKLLDAYEHWIELKAALSYKTHIICKRSNFEEFGCHARIWKHLNFCGM